MKIALLIPTLNEITGLRQIMPRIKKEWVDEIVFIDGNSTDGTVEYIREHGYKLFLERSPGLRHALVEVIGQIESEIVITFSPDGNCIPEALPDLIAKIREGYDMVIVSRYLKEAKSYDDNLVTAFGNWMFTTLVNFLYGGRYTDVMNIFRAYKKSLVRDLELDKEITYSVPERLFKTRIGWEPILSVRAARKKMKITEISGDEPKRIGGKAKLQVLRWGAAYLFQVIRDKFWWYPPENKV